MSSAKARKHLGAAAALKHRITKQVKAIFCKSNSDIEANSSRNSVSNSRLSSIASYTCKNTKVVPVTDDTELSINLYSTTTADAATIENPEDQLLCHDSISTMPCITEVTAPSSEDISGREAEV